ncbi:hypothetical protein [Emcibacter sp.]|uniref:hypothetical protein n=1 Tax=Emcibacter sp. TaxID=1979954 RepID=UPI002AA7B5EE|nr:hypothetical protein [Emcibacter sp.]
MTWQTVKKRQHNPIGRTGVAMAVTEEKNGTYNLRILIYSDVMQMMGWKHGDKINVMVGHGDHMGQVALEKTENGFTIAKHSRTIGRVSFKAPVYVPKAAMATTPARYEVDGQLVCTIPSTSLTVDQMPVHQNWETNAKEGNPKIKPVDTGADEGPENGRSEFHYTGHIPPISSLTPEQVEHMIEGEKKNVYTGKL